MSSPLITHFVERAAGGEPGLGTSAFLWGRAEYGCANGDRRRVWKLHEAAPAGEGSGVSEAQLKLLGDFLVGDKSISTPRRMPIPPQNKPETSNCV